LEQDSVLETAMSDPYQKRAYLEQLMFSSNLKEFSQRVEHICRLLDYGEMTCDEAEREIDALYQQLKQSATTLGIRP